MKRYKATFRIGKRKKETLKMRGNHNQVVTAAKKIAQLHGWKLKSLFQKRG